MDKKICASCQLPLPRDSFYAHPGMRDGLLNACKECHKAKVRANREAKLEHYREYDRARASRPERIKNMQDQVRRWRAEDSRRTAAHSAVARAIKNGTLVRKPCSRCGAEKAYAHHEDYDKKLEVMWLCQPCHKQRHKELAEMNIIP